MKPAQVPSSPRLAARKATVNATVSPARTDGVGRVAWSPMAVARRMVAVGIPRTANSHHRSATRHRVVLRNRMRTPSLPSATAVTASAVPKMSRTRRKLAASSMVSPSFSGRPLPGSTSYWARAGTVTTAKTNGSATMRNETTGCRLTAARSAEDVMVRVGCMGSPKGSGHR